MTAVLMPALYLLTVNWQFSAFYSPNLARFTDLPERRKADSRIALAQMETYAKAHGYQLPLFNKPSARRLCVGIVSIRRKEGEGSGESKATKDHEYLSQTTASLLTRIPWKYQDRVHITLYNVEKDPSEHWEAQKISRLLRTVSPDYRGITGQQVEEILKAGGIIYKENIDYQAALQDQLSLGGCQYSLILEDDVLATDGWYEQIERVLEAVPKDRPWHYVKLFSTLKFQGYQWDPLVIAEMLATIATAGIILFFSVFILLLALDSLCGDKGFKWSRQWLRECTLGQIILILALATVSVRVIGRQNIRIGLNNRLYPSETCILTQAVLYPREQLSVLDSYLTSHRHPRMPPIDMHFPNLASEYRSRSGKELLSFVWMPDLFQHIGLHSSLRKPKRSAIDEMLFSERFKGDAQPIRFEPN